MIFVMLVLLRCRLAETSIAAFETTVSREGGGTFKPMPEVRPERLRRF